MRIPLPTNLRTRLTFWYLTVLALLLIVYATLVFAFQYVVLTRQTVHDEIQDVETVEGLLFFDTQDHLQVRQALGNILEETARLNEAISSLLLLARAEATQPGHPQTTFIASELVDEVLELLQVVIEERNVTAIQEGESARQTSVRAERGLLRVAILNVLHNALKFSPSDSVLRISYLRSENPTAVLSIAIQDQGPGIAPGEHQRVFERFFTSNSQGTAYESGTGLGLSVAKLVIDRVGGKIWFDEEAPRGAKCIIELPISQ